MNVSVTAVMTNSLYNIKASNRCDNFTAPTVNYYFDWTFRLFNRAFMMKWTRVKDFLTPIMSYTRALFTTFYEQ